MSSVSPSPLKEASAPVSTSPARPTESPTKRKLVTAENLVAAESPAKKSLKMDNNPISGQGIVVLQEGNQQVSTEDAEKQQLRFRKISDNAFKPTRGSESKMSAGFDLQSAYDYTVPKGGSCLIKTDLEILFPEGTHGRIASHSALALEYKIEAKVGLLDQECKGTVEEIDITLFNHGEEDFSVAKGDHVAQLICQKNVYPEIVQVETLDSSERGKTTRVAS